MRDVGHNAVLSFCFNVREVGGMPGVQQVRGAQSQETLGSEENEDEIVVGEYGVVSKRATKIKEQWKMLFVIP